MIDNSGEMIKPQDFKIPTSLELGEQARPDAMKVAEELVGGVRRFAESEDIANIREQGLQEIFTAIRDALGLPADSQGASLGVVQESSIALLENPDAIAEIKEKLFDMVGKNQQLKDNPQI
jgi:5,10-methenyltetrahydromethanopterin hydrogenase